MFFRKKSSSEPITKSSIKKMDAVITGVILGGVIGSIYGIKKLKDRDKSHEDQTHLSIEEHPEKPSLWKRIFGKK